MKRFFSIILILASSGFVHAQCTMDAFSLQKRVYLSDIVIEGRVMASESFWNEGQTFIYTSHKVRIGKIFEGEKLIGQSTEITLITEGGIIGTDALKVEPSLSIRPNDVGIFLLKNSVLNTANCKQCLENSFVGVASEQSFIKYDESTLVAHGYFENYAAIEAGLYPKITSYTGSKYQILRDLEIGSEGIKSLAAPIITNWDLDTVASGTGALLTITGSNFGIIQDQGKVEFVDPNFGDGRYFDPVYASSYKSWSSKKIEVYVPTRAGSGKFKVTNTNKESKESAGPLYVKFAHSNVGYQGTTGIDAGFYQVNHINDNTKGGYTWRFNNKFAANSDAVNSFLRGAENWRCETLMNWEVGNNTSTDTIARDNENVVRFTEFSNSRLGVCYSWYSGCFNGGNVYWYVVELDVDFDSTRNWYYGTGSPGKSQTDFETVATHELGHGHQLSHVIDNSKIMHYSLAAGTRNVTLSKYDIEGGEYERDKSLNGQPCGPGTYKAIKAEDCNITQPEAGFVLSDTVLCPNTNLTVTDDTKGKVNSYSWTFGTDASSSGESTAGPHTIQYSSSGNKTIRLIVANDFGTDTLEKTITVSPDAPNSPQPIVYEDTVCVGEVVYGIAPVADASEYQWSVSAGGTISSGDKDTSMSLNWTTAGSDYILSVTASNSCGTSSAVTAIIDVLDIAVADFSNTDASLTIAFTNLSSSASSFTWDFGDGNQSSDKDPSHMYSTKGDYKVTLTASNVCSDSTISKGIAVNYGVGLDELHQVGLDIYPNPTHDIVHITCPSPGYVIEMYDGKGSIVLTSVLKEGTNSHNIEMLSTGTYTWVIEGSAGQQFSGKLLVQ